MSGTAKQRPIMVSGETRNGKVSFVDLLDSGESLTGTPTVVEVTTSELTISNAAVNTAEETINGETVAIGKAVLFKVTDGGSGDLATYTLRITVSTDATPAQTFERYVRFPLVEM